MRTRAITSRLDSIWVVKIKKKNQKTKLLLVFERKTTTTSSRGKKEESHGKSPPRSKFQLHVERKPGLFFRAKKSPPSKIH